MLTAKWTAWGIESYDKAMNTCTIVDESGNGNTAYGTNISKVYVTKPNRVDGEAVESAKIGVRSALEGGNCIFGEDSAGIGFNGHAFLRVPNSPSINLDVFTIRVVMHLYNTSYSQYIFDKRNSQWNRNYCLLYAAPDFPHLREGMEEKHWFSFDIGDGSPMYDDFDNGVYFYLEGLNDNTILDYTITYDKKHLAFWVGEQLAGLREKKGMGDITGDGDLIVGDAAYPHGRDVWPVYGSHTLCGRITALEIYDTVERVLDISKLPKPDHCIVEKHKKLWKKVEG